MKIIDITSFRAQLFMSGGDEFREIRTEFYNMGHASATWPVSFVGFKMWITPKRLDHWIFGLENQCVTAGIINFFLILWGAINANVWWF